MNNQQQEPDHVTKYQAKMQALYNRAAAADVFRQQYYPADPFDGELIDAAFLEIVELVNIFKAAKALEDEGNAEFIENLIHFRGPDITPLVRVNTDWLNTLRRRKNIICEFLQKAYFEFDSVEEVLGYEREIANMNDLQLTEYFCQAKVALACEAEMVGDAES